MSPTNNPENSTEPIKPAGWVEHSKISAEHLQRWAYVYVRQSSPRQVEHNRESQENQYRLVERAQALGWRRERIEVIDRDLGQSGRSTETRTGFHELSAAVSLGQVGILFGYEVSRLARHNSDWYRLLDLAALFGTLIADSDGVYDPRLYNDRLLLGLKGAMSEAELHILRLRLDAGRMNQVRKASFRQGLPSGLVRLADGRVTKDPDESVRHAIERVFNKLGELGSARQVQQYLTRHTILLPRQQHGGPHSGELLWKQATETMICNLLHNPAYAGAFAYGRRHTDRTTAPAGQSSPGMRRMPMDRWVELQQGV